MEQGDSDKLRAELTEAAAKSGSATLAAAVHGGRTTRALSGKAGEVVSPPDEEGADSGDLNAEIERLRRWRDRHPA